jgi:hypothetical protein
MAQHEFEKQGRKLSRREFEMDFLVKQCVQNSQSVERIQQVIQLSISLCFKEEAK